MSKPITFSRVFPSYHQRAGEPTLFVEKLWTQIGVPAKEFLKPLDKEFINFVTSKDDSIWKKKHTIRAGHRWKVGDKFSPRCWSGLPYRSKQIIIAPDIEIKEIYKFEIKRHHLHLSAFEAYIDDFCLSFDEINTLAQNDGLLYTDFMEWFQYPKPFVGQIICWGKMNY